MAEEESSGNLGGKLKALLTRRVAGIPAYVLMLVGILILAWYLKRRAAAKAASTPTDQSAGNVTSQTFPYGQPMNYSSDVFVNNSFPSSTPPTTTPLTAQVKEGTWLDRFIAKVNETNPGLNLTESKLRQLNPQLEILTADKSGYTDVARPGQGPLVKVIHTGVPGGNPTAMVRIQ